MHLVCRLRGGMFHQSSGRDGYDAVTGLQIVRVLLPDSSELEVPFEVGDTREVRS